MHHDFDRVDLSKGGILIDPGTAETYGAVHSLLDRPRLPITNMIGALVVESYDAGFNRGKDLRRCMLARSAPEQEFLAMASIILSAQRLGHLALKRLSTQ